MNDEGNTFEWAKSPDQSCSVSLWELNSRLDASTVFPTKVFGVRDTPSPDRNSRRPRVFAGSVDSLNSIHRVAELRVIQLRFLVLYIHRSRGDKSFAAPQFPHNALFGTYCAQ